MATTIRSIVGVKQGTVVTIDYISGVPNITSLPTISGAPSVPNTLSIVLGTATGASYTSTYQWKRNGVVLPGATNPTYQLETADEGTNISVVWSIVNNFGSDSAESASVLVDTEVDTVAPTITSSTISNISYDRFNINTTTNEESTHYFIVVLAGSTAPTQSQVIAGVNYGAVVVKASGSQLGLSTNQNTTQGAAVGLIASTAYDVYRVAVDAALNISTISSNLNVSTTAAGTYEPIPSAPQLTSPSTVTSAGGADLDAGDVPTKHAIISGDWNILNIKGLVGTEAAPYILVNENAAVEIGGVSPKNHAMRTNFSGSTHFELHGLSPSAPFILTQNSTTGTIEPSSGLVIDAISTGTHAKVVNFVVKDVGFAGVFMNTSGTLSGGTATNPPTSHVYYQDIEVSFFRVFGLAAEGEAFYIGGTNPSAYAIHYNYTLTHSLGTNKGRDGLQLNGHANAIVRNCTYFNVGVVNSPQQRNLVQCQNGKFLVENCIFDGAPALCNLSGHDIVFRNCYFRWTSAEAGYLGNYYSQYGTCCRLVTTPVKVLFDDCIFAPDQVVPDVLRVDDPNVDVEFLDCIFTTNCSDLYFSNRGASPSGVLIGTLTTNGNTHVAPGNVPPVTYTNFIPSDYENHGLVTEPYYLERGMGYRTRSGVVIPPTTPTVQASNIVASNVLDTSMTLTWTKSTDAIGSLMLMKAGSAVDSLPIDNTGYTASSVFGSGSQLGTGNYVVYNAGGNSVNITGLTASTTYHIRIAASNGSGATSLYLTTTATLNPISQATTATQPFNPFTDITWDTALDKTTAEADLASSIWTNKGVDANAIVANGTPSWDAVKGAVRFTRADNERFTIQAAGSYVAPIEFWFKVITPTAWSTSPQTIAGLSNTHHIRFDANTGALIISSTATGFTPALNTEYDIRIKFNGASSTWTIDNGTETTISLSTNSMGTPNWRLGAKGIDTEHFDGWIKYVFAHDQTLTTGEISNMWTWITAN